MNQTQSNSYSHDNLRLIVPAAEENDRLLINKIYNNNTTTNYGSASQTDISTENEVAPEDKGSTLVVAFFLMLLFQLGNRIFGRLETYPMHNYPIFMNMLSTFIYIPICFAYIIPMIKFGKSITKEQLDISQYKFAIMGGYDSIAGIMQTFATNYISSSSTIVLVQQSAIPISMLISKVALQARYTTSQYVGAGVVLLGIVTVLIPTFSSSNSTNSDSTNSLESSNTMQMLWILVLVLSCVPMCLSSVYKEKALGEVEIDVIYLNGCVAVFQFLFSIPISVPSAQVIHIPMNEIIPNLIGGMKCWFGINSSPDDNCEAAPHFVSLFLFFNIFYNFLIVVILKHGSANILWMASTVIVPLSNVVFSLDFVPGHKPMTSWDIVGLFVIMIGLVIYRFSTEIFNFYKKCILGKIETVEEVQAQQNARNLAMRAERKQLKYVGLNQIEGLQSIFDSRVMKEKRKVLSRTSGQIRGTLLNKLGIPASPYITMVPMRKNSITRSAVYGSNSTAVPIGINHQMTNKNFAAYSPSAFSYNSRQKTILKLPSEV